MSQPEKRFESWLAGLAGAPTVADGGGSSAGLGFAEGAALRHLMLTRCAERAQTVQAPTLASEELHWAQLRTRLLPLPEQAAQQTADYRKVLGQVPKVGRLAPMPPSVAPPGWQPDRAAHGWRMSAGKAPRWGWVGFAVTALVMLAVTQRAKHTAIGDDTVPIMRGAESAQIIPVASAEALEAQIARLELQFQALHVQYRIDRVSSGAVIRAAIPAVSQPPMRRQAPELEVPDHGRLLVQVLIVKQ